MSLLIQGSLVALYPLLLAFLLSWALTFGVRRFALARGIIAKANARRRHDRPTALLGGVGIYLALLPFIVLFSPRPQAWGYALALTLVFGMGVVDDCLELKASKKLAVEIIAGAVLIASEPSLSGLFHSIGIPLYLGYPLALIWVVGITNAMNLIDGLDGLCSGAALLSALSLSAMSGSSELSGLSLALAGACAGFLVHNFHPARIFLGDCGSLLLGFALSSLTLKLDYHGSWKMAATAPLLIFSVPIIDTLLAIARRTLLKRPVFSADRNHLHHRLQHLGISQRKAALVLYMVQGYTGLAAMGIGLTHGRGSVLVVALALPALTLFLGFLRFTENAVSRQSARLSYLFLTEELNSLADTDGLRDFIGVQAERHKRSGLKFSVVQIDFSGYLKEIVNEKPTDLVTFYVRLYGLLRARLRGSDLIARPSELQFVIVLPETWDVDGSHASIFSFLRASLKALQEGHRIFQGDPVNPEGFSILIYPQDRGRILRLVQHAAEDPASRARMEAAKQIA